MSEIDYKSAYETVLDANKTFYKEIERLLSIIKEVREYIEFELEEVLKEKRYDLHYHTIDGLHIKKILEILDKVEEEENEKN